MSKSAGNAQSSLSFVDEFGADAFRYFLLREMNVGQDSDFSREQFLVRYEADLANNLGNLVNRTLNMTTRFSKGLVPAVNPAAWLAEEQELKALWETTGPEFIALCEGFQFHQALDRLFAFVRAINAYIEKLAPWKLGKSAAPADQARLHTALAVMAETLRLAATALEPVMPVATEKIHAVLGRALPESWTERLVWGEGLTGSAVAAALVLFPRPAPSAQA